MAELPTQRDFEDFSAWTGRDVVAPDGERLGAVELIFLDEATEVPEWVLVRLEDEDPPPSSRSPARRSRNDRSASSRTASGSPPRRGSRSRRR